MAIVDQNEDYYLNFPDQNTEAELNALYAEEQYEDTHTEDCEEIIDFDGSTTCTCGGDPCDSGFQVGQAHDPYGVSCEHIQRDHPKNEKGVQVHRARNPFPGNGVERMYVEWTGGGYCAGDPLPVRDVKYIDGEVI